jgi:hypothetical protein
MPGLIEQILEAGSDNADHFCKGINGAHTGGYRIQQDPEEFAKLISILREYGPYENALSIGIAAGGNERFMLEHIKIGALAVVDDGKHPNHRFWAEQNKPAIPVPVFEHIGDSHSKKAAKFLKDLGIKFNLVAIDGDHSPAGVRMDWALIQPYLAPGAVVWLHDIHLTEPGQTGAAELWFELRKHHKVILEVRRKFGIGAVKL